jgi:hypothetical protein
MPSAPQNLSAAPGATTGVKLTWAAPASNGGSAIANYMIYRGTSSGGEVFLKKVGNVLTFKDNATTSGTTYFYRVSAVNGTGEGPQSTEKSAVAK